MSEDTPALVSLEEALITLIVDAWRFTRASVRTVEKLDAGASGRFASQIRYFQDRIGLAAETAGLKLVSLEGHPFDPGMAVTALNMDDFGAEDELIVDQMIEPILMGESGVRRQGTVLLRRRN